MSSGSRSLSRAANLTYTKTMRDINIRRQLPALHLALLLLAPPVLTTACFPGTSKAAFIDGADELRCSGVYPVCQGQVAGCMLDKGHYLAGVLPGSRKFLVETPHGDWKIRVKLFLDPTVGPRFPGTDLEIAWFEPGCTDQYSFKLSKDNTTAGDLFERAGRDNVFSTEHSVIDPGDHLVTIFSDATTRYILKIEILKES